MRGSILHERGIKRDGFDIEQFGVKASRGNRLTRANMEKSMLNDDHDRMIGC